MYCATCLAVVELTITKLGKSVRESDIFEVLEGICAPGNFYGWKFLPPYLSDTCDEIRAGWEQQLETLLLPRVWPENVELHQHISKHQANFGGNNSITRSYHGIDLDK